MRFQAKFESDIWGFLEVKSTNVKRNLSIKDVRSMQRP